MYKTNEPIRVLHVVGRMDRGGIETMIMNIYRNIDREKVQFDFLAHYGREAEYNDEIRSLGGRIYEMPALKDEEKVYYWKIFSYIKALNAFFKEHSEYKIIHGHMTNTALIYFSIAKKYGINCRISHSHNSKGKDGLLGTVTDFLQKDLYKYATDYFACSKVAANWFYPENVIKNGKVKIIANGVDGKKFSFNQNIRSEMRKKLDFNNSLVIGCIARFRPEKNQMFLLDIFKHILEMQENSILVFAGDGPMEIKVKEKAIELGISDRVRFLGVRSDIPELMQAIDVFVLTSFWEGLPVVGIEAQASGLPCVVSDSITNEMNVINLVEYVSLDCTAEEWARRIIEVSKKPRKNTYKLIKEAGYDISTVTEWLQNFYLEKSEVKEYENRNFNAL